MLRTQWAMVVIALGLATACGNSKPVNNPEPVDWGSGEAADAGPKSPEPVDETGTPPDPAKNQPKPGAGSSSSGSTPG